MAEIKESKELLLGLMEVLEAMGPVFKDGFQAGQDLPAILLAFSANEELKSKFQAALDGAGSIPEEVKDLSLSESLELLIAIAPELPKVIAAWKK